tara:strand:+ start:1545 stop:1838 length:294 start_codon:yes stop_codon:yes gene_type:complete
MSTFYPSRGKVAIERISKGGEQVNEHGIIYTEKDNDFYIKGTILSIGLPTIAKNGIACEPTCSIGDIVYYDRREVNTIVGLDVVPVDAIMGVVDESK